MTINANKTSFVLTVIAIVGFGTLQPVVAQQYTITDLGTLGGVSSGASGVNNEGQVVGASTLYSGAKHAYLWEGGTIYDLGTPPGFLVSSASASNNLGQVVGTTEGEYQSQYAYIWEEGVWSYLGTLPGPGLDYSATADINSAGQIVGYSFTLGPGSAHRAWIWEDGEMTDLGTLGGADCSASAINELGQVVGWAQTDNPDFITHAFFWEAGVMTDLGTLPGDTGSSAADVNQNGQVCGTSTHPVPPYFTAQRSCMWEDGVVVDLGVLPGYAKSLAAGINDRGQVVGYLGISLSGSAAAAFIWEGGVMTDLNGLIPPGSGWVLKSASEINEAGEIVGWGTAPNGESHGFLLTPVCLADLDGDLDVDLSDLSQLLASYGTTSGAEYANGDLDGDGDVDLADLADLLSMYGTTCP